MSKSTDPDNPDNPAPQQVSSTLLSGGNDELNSNSPPQDSFTIVVTDTESEVDSESVGTASEEEDDGSNPNESLSSTIIREIQDGTYVCLICTNEIDRSCKVWSCDACFRVYDLACIKDWANRGSSTDKAKKSWRCPACNVAHTNIPTRFTCWCKRTHNPSTQLLVPFSCGNPCSYKYPNCVHACSSACHPGEHPVCGAMGPVQKCHCGKHSQQLPCLITPYKTGWTCPDPCEIPVCDLHVCPKKCHSGFCGPCEERVLSQCYCGQATVAVKCSEKLLKSCKNMSGSWVAVGACPSINKVYYDCAIHYETVVCGPLPMDPPQCAFAPQNVTTCYCGKSAVDASMRTSCTEPIPECDSVCGRTMECGCTCAQKCHSGPCECFSVKEAPCRCGHETFLVPCKFLQSGSTPQCGHKCQALLSCRKHYHRAICCPDEPVALAREREKKKAIRNNTRSSFGDEIMTIEPTHICTKPCMRLKLCGQHYCSALCHAGPCGTCYESSNDDLVCNCGKTIIEAPVRCGTTINCRHQCIRPKACGHRPEIHECHDDEQPCPTCKVLVEKFCQCGAKELRGVFCFQSSVSCGTICTVAKHCGHFCLRLCDPRCTKDNEHAPANTCNALCGKQRVSCPHRCAFKCHFEKSNASADCDLVACTEPVTTRCECGTLAVTQACGASTTVPTRLGTIIHCDEECDKAKRQRELREAFSLAPVGGSDKYPYPDLVLTTFSRQKAWCSKIESTLCNFIANYREHEHNSAKTPKRTLIFTPMSRPQRAFVHALAECYDMYVESQDEEPKRRVFVVITRLSKVPEKLIEQVLLEQAERAAQKEAAAEAARLELELARQDDKLFNAVVLQFLRHTQVDEFTLPESVSSLLQQEFAEFRSIVNIEDDGDENDTTTNLKRMVFHCALLSDTMTIEDQQRVSRLAQFLKKRIPEMEGASRCILCTFDHDQGKMLKVEKTFRAGARKLAQLLTGPDKSNFAVLQDDNEKVGNKEAENGEVGVIGDALPEKNELDSQDSDKDLPPLAEKVAESEGMGASKMLILTESMQLP